MAVLIRILMVVIHKNNVEIFSHNEVHNEITQIQNPTWKYCYR